MNCLANLLATASQTAAVSSQVSLKLHSQKFI